MKILHYFLGFPPYRSGGMTKYAFDLMTFQAKDGNEVSALWPGRIASYSAQPKIKIQKDICGVHSYELINPLPVSLDEGITDFDAYMKSCDTQNYITFLNNTSPDVIHIHTLMGLHKEFFDVAESMHIRTVFTTHDYYGLCPKVTFYRYGECCLDDNHCKNCIQCNANALSLKKIQLLQSPVYRQLKDTALIKSLRKQHRGTFFDESSIPDMPNVDIDSYAKKYEDLRNYYKDILEKIDFIHFNSSISEKVFKRFITPKTSSIISITHKGISKHNIKKIPTGKKVILCLFPAKPFKGFSVLREACDILWAEGDNIELRIYSPVKNPAEYMKIRENGFKAEELETIMAEADVLVAPSVWFETFGFTVLEALSFGVPAIVSDRVGAKDILGDNGIIVKAGDVLELKNAIKNIDISVNAELKTWDTFMRENYEIYEVK